MPRLCLIFLLIFLCWGFSQNNPNDSFNDMPAGLKEAWTNGYQVKQYYTDKKTGEVTVFSRPVRFGKSNKSEENQSSSKEKNVTELPPSYGNSPTYLKKPRFGSKCKSSHNYSSINSGALFELPAEAYGEECGDLYTIRQARKLKKRNSVYNIQKISQKQFRKIKKEEKEAAIPDHRLTWYELMKRKNKKADALKKLKESLAATSKKTRSTSRKRISPGKQYSSFSSLNKFSRKTKQLKRQRYSKSKYKKNTGKLKSKVFGFSKKGGGKKAKSYFGRLPSGNYSSSQSPSSNRMIFYAPNKSSSYEWGTNSKAKR